MEKQYLSVREYAKILGITVQAVYKKINQADNQIQPFIKRVEKKVYIDKAILDELPLDEKPNEKEERAEEKLIQHLEEELAELRKQLAEKDIQIAQLLNQVSESMTLLNQQQQLTAIATQKKKPGLLAWFGKKENPGN